MHVAASLDGPGKAALARYLAGFVTERRHARFLDLVRLRTRHLTIVLEDIYQPHNASAVLRSCDCFGIQDVHIIENKNQYQVNPDVALGSSGWLTIHKYRDTENNTAGCIESLRQQGYRIAATSPHVNGFTPENYPLEQKTALVFGTELQGLTKTALDLADDYIYIPMSGFTESLNISVSAAILLHTLSVRLRQSDIAWQLDSDQSTEVLLHWLTASVKNSGSVIRRYLETTQPEGSRG